MRSFVVQMSVLLAIFRHVVEISVEQHHLHVDTEREDPQNMGGKP
jgi:hypothetical protein